jgi:hypothetical protein
MARQVINSNSVQPLGVPNTGTSTEQGDTWDNAVLKLNAMFVDLYTGTALNAGTGTATYGASGNIAKLTATVNSVGTNTTQTLQTYTVPANTFAVPGEEITVMAWGTVANNAAPKTIALQIGAAQITTGTVTGAAFAWELNGNYLCTSATAENYWLSGFGSGTSPLTNKAGTDSVAISGTFNITVTCADASAATNNVSLLGFTVEYFA